MGEALPAAASLSRLPDGRLVVALSGGLDSLVLLHALRFGERRRGLVAAHLDHAMHPSSAGTRAWVVGVCRAWGVPLVHERLEEAPASEAAARDARYRFLERVRAGADAAGIVTAHHADDQAETVLFRILRGAGARGLSGMRSVRGRIHRPLLEVRRREIRSYAEAAGLRWREDPTNRDVRYARNRIRHHGIPALGRAVDGAGEDALLHISHTAREVLDRAERLDRLLLRTAATFPAPGRAEFASAALDRFSDEARLRLLRYAAHSLDGHLSRRGTRIAARALVELQPGRGVDLTGGFRLERGLNEWVLLSPLAAEVRRQSFSGGVSPHSSGPFRVDATASMHGSAELKLGGQGWRVAWRPSPWPREVQAAFARDAHLPLTVRGWRPGDRIRLNYGSKSVAKLLAEAGVSAMDRSAAPVFLGEDGRILWVPGACGGPGGATWSDDSLYITCTRISA